MPIFGEKKGWRMLNAIAATHGIFEGSAGESWCFGNVSCAIVQLWRRK
jgi:hypothetical protein